MYIKSKCKYVIAKRFISKLYLNLIKFKSYTNVFLFVSLLYCWTLYENLLIVHFVLNRHYFSFTVNDLVWIWKNIDLSNREFLYLMFVIYTNKKGNRVIPRWASKQFEIAQTPNKFREQHVHAVFSGDHSWCCACMFAPLNHVNISSTWNTIVYNISSGDLIPYEVY